MTRIVSRAEEIKMKLKNAFLFLMTLMGMSASVAKADSVDMLKSKMKVSDVSFSEATQSTQDWVNGLK